MSDNPHFSIAIHAGIARAEVSDVTTALILNLEGRDFGPPRIALFTGDADLTDKLAAAINATLAAHAAGLAQREAPVSEAAE